MKYLTAICFPSIVVMWFILFSFAHNLDITQKRLNIVESHLNVAGQKIQDLDYEISVLTDLQKEEK